MLEGRIAGQDWFRLVPLPVLQGRPGVVKDVASAIPRLPGAGLVGLPGGERADLQLQFLLLKEAMEPSRHLIFILFY